MAVKFVSGGGEYFNCFYPCTRCVIKHCVYTWYFPRVTWRKKNIGILLGWDSNLHLDHRVKTTIFLYACSFISNFLCLPPKCRCCCEETDEQSLISLFRWTVRGYAVCRLDIKPWEVYRLQRQISMEDMEQHLQWELLQVSRNSANCYSGSRNIWGQFHRAA